MNETNEVKVWLFVQDGKIVICGQDPDEDMDGKWQTEVRSGRTNRPAEIEMGILRNVLSEAGVKVILS